MKVDVPDVEVVVPDFMREIITEVSHHARKSPDVSQRSGVSVRTTIANLEAVIANAQRRSIVQREPQAVPRISDLAATYPSTMGKIEFETYGEGRDEQVLDRIIGDAVRKVFVRSVDPSNLEALLTAFENGLSVTASDSADAFSYIHQVSAVDNFASTIDSLVQSKEPGSLASAIEFVLEGLHQTRKVSRKRSRDNGAVRYGR